MSEYKKFYAEFWKEWFEREEKLESEQMCMHNHSDAHQWKPLGSIEKIVQFPKRELSKQICEKCLEIRDKI